MRAHYNALYWGIITVLVVCSLFFTYHVVTFKKGLTAGAGDIRVASGDTVTFVKAIDGDEIAVQAGDANFVVRILGIKAFDPTVNDPQMAGIAARSVAYLDRRLSGRRPSLEFSAFKTDRRKRVLAYVVVEGEDLGRQMVAEGLALVYTLYPFDRMVRYQEIEDRARKEKIGLWGNPVAVERADLLKVIWEQEQEKSDV